MWCKLAVIRAKRQQGKFEILPKAMDLCVYTITICKSEKSFPKRNRWILTQPIVNEAIAILTNVRYANSVRIVEREDGVQESGDRFPSGKLYQLAREHVPRQHPAGARANGCLV